MDNNREYQQFELGNGKSKGAHILWSDYYPSKIDGKLQHELIEQCEIDPRRRRGSMVMSKKRNEVIFTDYVPLYLMKIIYNLYYQIMGIQVKYH